MVYECQIRYLTYSRAWGRAEKLHTALVSCKRPVQNVVKVKTLAQSFKKKSEDLKLLLINGNQNQKH